MTMARMAISLSMARPGCQRYKPSVMTLALAGLALVARRCRRTGSRAGCARWSAVSASCAAPARQHERTARGSSGSLAVTRAHLADVVAGEPPPRDVIERGAPYRDIEPAPGAGALPAAARPLRARRPHAGRVQRRSHPARAHSIPLDELEDRLGELPPTRPRPCSCTCAAGGRSDVGVRASWPSAAGRGS